MLVGGAVFGLFIDFLFFYNIFSSLFWHGISFIVGLMLMFAVMKISRNTGKILAKYGRVGDIPRMKTNQLVTQGIYADMRHPMHLGLMLFPLSFAFIVGSITFIFVIAPLEIIFILIMILQVEEPEAIKKFGQDYFAYMQQTPAFCFKVKCLKKLFAKLEKN